MIGYLAIFLVVGTSLSLPTDEWSMFKEIHKKVYEAEEDARRMALWAKTKEEVATHNRNFDLGLETYSMAVNQFADMTVEEFFEKFTGVIPQNASNSDNVKFHEVTNVTLPSAIDWRSQGIVTGVKNQGSCGSCWAFSTTGALEGQQARKHGRLISLSEQNLVDCSYPEGNQGCNGGWMDQGFRYVIVNHGIDTENSYPYHASVGRCNFNRNSIGARASSFVDVRRGSEGDLTNAIATVGPIAVAIQVTGNFMRYGGGVFNDRACNGGGMNHGVLAVGYGTQGSTPYYLVKNSWGLGFGERGYIRMIRNAGNRCNIASAASYPIMQ